ncbi:MAG: hypothetical protein H0W69_09475 [Gemmatimonadaceae bacterium]|nr:hypothetical protein [Gemmatimonadaceae bacterium]
MDESRAQAEILSQLTSIDTLRDFRVKTAGTVTRNYFSILFPVFGENGQNLMVKIPKTDLRNRKEVGMFPLTDEDRRLGRAEFESLQLMSSHWDGSETGVNWVRPLGYLADFNAIVTELVDAQEAWGQYHRRAFRHLLGSNRDGSALKDAMSRLGQSLGRFHSKASGAPVSIPATTMADRIDRYLGRLQTGGARIPSLESRNRGLGSLRKMQWLAPETTTFKGIDIRNILIAEPNAIWILDPGKIKRGPAEADLARFLVTWRILFWGTPWFALGLVPHLSLESGFTNAYKKVSPINEQLLDAYLLKEILKHWHTAYETLSYKKMRRPFRTFLKAVYIDPFYRRQANVLLNRLAT